MRRVNRSHAGDRSVARKQANMRLIRTVLLGTVAVGAAIVWMGDQYGIERAETIRYLATAVGFVVGLAFLGLMGFLLILGVRKLTRDR